MSAFENGIAGGVTTNQDHAFWHHFYLYAKLTLPAGVVVPANPTVTPPALVTSLGFLTSLSTVGSYRYPEAKGTCTSSSGRCRTGE